MDYILVFGNLSLLLLLPPLIQPQLLSRGIGGLGLESPGRMSRFLSVFTIHQFANEPCLLDSGDVGTCFSSAECRTLGGASGGYCAGGFGVCCALFATCGSRVLRNNTHFVNPRYPESGGLKGACVVRVPGEVVAADSSAGSSDRVCQLRLQIQQLVLAAPDSSDHQCKADQLIISSRSLAQPIVLCGNLTGQHLYVDIDGASSVSLAVNSKENSPLLWAIAVQRIQCATAWTAPPGCQQYFTDVSGQFSSFNFRFNEGAMISSLDYTVCFRRAVGRCGLALRQCEDRDRPASTFTVSGDTRPGRIRQAQSGDLCVSDWLQVACGSDRGVAPHDVTSAGYTCADRFCGSWFNALEGAGAPATVYTFVQPFAVHVHTNSGEGNDSASADYDNRGFCLQYSQLEC